MSLHTLSRKCSPTSFTPCTEWRVCVGHLFATAFAVHGRGRLLQAGLEPARESHADLSRARLPIAPLEQKPGRSPAFYEGGNYEGCLAVAAARRHRHGVCIDSVTTSLSRKFQGGLRAVRVRLLGPSPPQNRTPRFAGCEKCEQLRRPQDVKIVSKSPLHPARRHHRISPADVKTQIEPGATHLPSWLCGFDSHRPLLPYLARW